MTCGLQKSVWDRIFILMQFIVILHNDFGYFDFVYFDDM